MAKRAKTKRKKISLSALIFRRDPSRQTGERRFRLAGPLKVFAGACILAGIATGTVMLEKYVSQTQAASDRPFSLELVAVPVWVNDELKEKVYSAAKGADETMKLDENTAATVQQNIESLVPWLKEVTVQTLPDRVRVEGRWRKPVALVRWAQSRLYVDAESVVLNYVPMPHLPIVELKGLSPTTVPPTGNVWHQEDLMAAVAVLAALDRMDASVTPDRPLLYEIASIDVSNYKGRKSARSPHIVLNAKDRTQIIWGAEVGTWAQYLEATDEDKLAKLYGYYKESGSLLNGAKYINLRDPQDKIPLPIDRY